VGKCGKVCYTPNSKVVSEIARLFLALTVLGASLLVGVQWEMPFGEFQYSVDDKGRVIIPPSFRDFVGDGMVVTRGMDGCLYIFPLPHWRDIEEKLTKLPITDGSSRNFTRFFYSGASKTTIDAAGRITLPNTLRMYAGINSDVVIAGTPNHLEVWDEAKWLSNLAQVESQPPTPDLLRELIG
jgi:MraZ protein